MSDLYENYIMDVEEIGKEDTKMLPESRQIEQKYLGQHDRRAPRAGRRETGMTSVFDDRCVPCYKCAFCGKLGKDSRDSPIAYCLLKKIITDPEIGCKEYKLAEGARK